MSPITNSEMGNLGTIIVLKDISEIQKIDRIKTQRLNAISKINTIIKSS